MSNEGIEKSIGSQVIELGALLGLNPVQSALLKEHFWRIAEQCSALVQKEFNNDNSTVVQTYHSDPQLVAQYDSVPFMNRLQQQTFSREDAFIRTGYLLLNHNRDLLSVIAEKLDRPEFY